MPLRRATPTQTCPCALPHQHEGTGIADVDHPATREIPAVTWTQGGGITRRQNDGAVSAVDITVPVEVSGRHWSELKSGQG